MCNGNVFFLASGKKKKQRHMCNGNVFLALIVHVQWKLLFF